MLLEIAITTLLVSLLATKWLAEFFGVDSLRALPRLFANAASGKRPLLTSLFQVDEKSERNGGELVASVLKAHGVTEIFTLCGGHISPILVACEKLDIRVVDTRHEATAVFAADASARLRQSVGVAAVTAGPGITNTVTALKNAQMAESAVVLLGGAAPTLLRGRGALQDIEQLELLRPLCKYVTRVTLVRKITSELRKAIRIALSGTPGPVFVELPIDVLFPYQLVYKEMGFSVSSKTSRSFFKVLMDCFLHFHISRQFGRAWVERDITPLPIKVAEPRPLDILGMVEVIAKSQRPLLIVGSQALLPPVKPEELASIVKKLGIPVYLGGMSRGLLGRNCKLHMRQNRREAIKRADVVLLAGSVCDFRLGYGKIFSSNSTILAINRNREQLNKNHKVFWRGNLLVEADVGLTLQVVQARLTREKQWNGAPEEWIDQLREMENQKEELNEKLMAEVKTSNGCWNPLAILSRVEKALPENAILVADGGDFVGSAAYILRPRGPLKWLDPGAFGTLGVGAGFALGAKTVHPNCPVVIIYGDGASGFSLIELDTCKRHNLPMIALIGNDACWSQIARDQVPWFNSAFTDYHRVAEGLGAKGLLLSKESDERDLDEILRVAFETNGQSVVINAILGKSDFRAGSISV